MADVEIRDIKNNTIEKMTLNGEIFSLPVKNGILHEAIVNYLSNQRQGTHATKTRGKVRGGGRKPWRQKHTGRARAGTSSSPLWKGGGTVFGPQPRDYSYALNKKQKRLALKTSLSSKVSENKLFVIDSFSMDGPSTKKMVALFDTFDLTGKKVLIITKEKDSNVYLSARNIPHTRVRRVSDLNTYEIIVHEFLLMTKDALISLQEAMHS